MLVPRPSPSPLGHGLPSPWQLPNLPTSLGLALGFVAGVITTIAAWMIGAGHDPAVGLLLLTAAAAVGSLTTSIGALASALQCWAFYTGFLLNRQGILTFDHASRSALAIIVFVGVVPSLLLTTARRFASWQGHTYKH